MTGNTLSTWIADLDIWPLVVMLLPYFFLFRKHGAEVRVKRLASLYHALMVFVITSAAGLIAALDLTDTWLAPAVGVVAIAAYVLRRQVFPYRLSCPGCGRAYNPFSADLKVIYVMDDDLCDACRSTPGQTEG